jgi:hypothetical protein
MFLQFCSSAFPKASAKTSYPEPATPAPTTSVDQTFMLVQMQQMQMTMMQERMSNSNQGPHTSQKHCHDDEDDKNMLSSEAMSSWYSSVADFLAKLHLCHPKCNLECYAVILDESDYYAVDDLKDLSKQQLIDRFEMSSGNVSFLLREVNNKIKCTNKLTKHCRHTK